ncbi:MAG TPA: metallophosphoesterase family protein, partial [Abditibacteriaceae bacterium]|nr:metallophosphoesterase family protein [Abditibacteriaceae bacterium]
LSQTRQMQIEQIQIGLAHGDVGNPSQRMGSSTRWLALSHFPDADCVVFGHSHRPLIEWLEMNDGKGGLRPVLLFNPGSATKKRGAPQHSCGLLRIDGKHIEPQLITW